MKYFLYARKSTDTEDKQVLSIEAQLAELRAIAKRDGLDVVEEFVEKRSAKTPAHLVAFATRNNSKDYHARPRVSSARQCAFDERGVWHGKSVYSRFEFQRKTRTSRESKERRVPINRACRLS